MHRNRIIIVVMVISLAAYCFAGTHYVSLTGTNDVAHGYPDWVGAATNIQWAVDSSATDDTVLVTNGIYVLTNWITVSSGITITSVNGAVSTIVDGNYPNTTNQCFYIHHTNAIIDGFTISNGYGTAPLYTVGGGGVRLSGGTLRNCVIASNSASQNGGGIYIYASSISVPSKLLNCMIQGNSTRSNPAYGGGIYIDGDGIVVSNCTILENSVTQHGGGIGISGTSLVEQCMISNNVSSSYGGGVSFIAGDSIVSGCTIAGNSADVYGGAAYFNTAGRLFNSIIKGNVSALDGGGIYAVGNGFFVRNCLIFGNQSTNSYGGGIRCAVSTNTISILDSCAIVSNYSLKAGGGIRVVGTDNNQSYWVTNCIVFWNKTNSANDNISHQLAGMSNRYYNCCVPVVFTPGQSNLTNDPQFVNLAEGDCRLGQHSPCINTGKNEDWMTGAVDMGGRSRIDRFSRVVDMGCYEYLPQGFMFSAP